MKRWDGKEVAIIADGVINHSIGSPGRHALVGEGGDGPERVAFLGGLHRAVVFLLRQ